MPPDGVGVIAIAMSLSRGKEGTQSRRVSGHCLEPGNLSMATGVEAGHVQEGRQVGCGVAYGNYSILSCFLGEIGCHVLS